MYLSLLCLSSEKVWFLSLKIKCPLIETLELIIHCQVHMLNEVLLPVNVTVLARTWVFRNVINIKKGSSILDWCLYWKKVMLWMSLHRGKTDMNTLKKVGSINQCKRSHEKLTVILDFFNLKKTNFLV